jgi:hypothetical protein
VQWMISKGFEPNDKAHDGSLPFHCFVGRGIQCGSHNVVEDAEFLDLVFHDLVRDIPNDVILPPVLVSCFL